MGKKYIIEIPEDKIADFVGSTHFLMPYMMAGHIGHHDTGLPIEPYTEPDLDAICNEAYEKGVQDTKQHWVDAPRTCAYQLGYENGLNEAWDAARKVADMSYGDGEKIFGVSGWHIIEKRTASEVIAKIKEHDDGKHELHIGDMVTFKTAHGEDTGIVVDCHVPDVYSDVDKYVVWCGSKAEYIVKKGLTKTGAHFSEIASILQKIKEMKKE